MAVTKQKKTEVLEKLRGVLAGATSLAFVNFKGLSVGSANALRRSLRQQGVGYLVAKKTLIKRALEEAKFEGNMPEFPGELAIAWSTTDQLAPAREIHAAGKKLEGALTLIGGIFEARFMDKAAIASIATIPSREVLYAQFVQLLASGIRGLTVALDQIAKKKS